MAEFNLPPKEPITWLTVVLRLVAGRRPAVAVAAIAAAALIILLAGCTPGGAAAGRLAEQGADKFCESWLSSRDPLLTNDRLP